MNCLKSTTRRGAIVLALVAISAVSARQAVAQPEGAEAALKAAHAELVQALNGVDDLFYKQKTAENGTTFYTIMWESGGRVD
ncbi:hypothetical protein OAS39_00710 [Pirellulales bacterium]|nr:hypothetical protein [Pirellulales bacterium]